MKRFEHFSITIFLFLMFFVCGCDQKVPSLVTSTFNLSGKVYEYDYLKGVTNINAPVELVVVSVSGPTITSTMTSSKGAYSFLGLPLGEYQITVSKEGYQRNGQISFSINYNFSSSSFASTDQVLDSDLDPRPVFLGSSVANYEEVPATCRTFKMYFNEPMSKESVTAFLKMLSLRSASVSGMGIQGSSISWEADGKTMSLTANNDLQPDALYQVGIACPNPGFGVDGIRDLQNHPIYGTQKYDNNLYNTSADNYYGVYIYVPFKTTTDKLAIPPVPCGLSKRSSVTGSREVDYNSLFSSSSGVTLSFTGSSDANGYRLYVSADGQGFSYAKEFANPSVFVSVNDVVSALGAKVACGFENYGYPIEPGLPWPFLGSGTYLRVSAYNSFGESQLSEILKVVDSVSPEADSAAISESGGVKVIKFSEPLDKNSAENIANYVTGVATPSVVSVSLVNDFNYSFTPYKKSFVRLTLNANDAGPRTIKMNGIKDLSGNLIRKDSTAAY